MEDVDLRHAKEHLEELLERAARGEDVRISDPRLGIIRLTAVAGVVEKGASAKRLPGRWKDRIPEPPSDFFDPMPDVELKDWYGDKS